MEGQGEFRQPPSDNYNLPLDPYRAAESFVMVCSYVDGMTPFDYTWTKDGANFQPSSVGIVGDSELATVPVPNGEYLSLLSPYLVSPAQCAPHLPLTHMHSHVRVVSCTMSIC